MSPQTTKRKLLDRVAEDNGLAIVVQDENGHVAATANNNSICRTLLSSDEYAPKCAEFCGRAFQNTADGATYDYECHAGLQCRAIPVVDGDKRFVAIIGRTFARAENYRKATERAASGDWARFPSNELFEYILLTASMTSFDKAEAELSRFRAPVDAVSTHVEAMASETAEPQAAPSPAAVEAVEVASEVVPDIRPDPPPASQQQIERRAAEVAKLRSLYGHLATLEYDRACAAVLEFAKANFDRDSLIWLEAKDNRLVTVAAIGALQETPIRIGIPADNHRLVNTRDEAPLELREKVGADESRMPRVLHLFPSIVGGELRGAIGVEGELTDAVARSMSVFCRRISPQIEILRLRREVSDREWLNRAVTRFNESLRRIDAEDFWTHVTQVSAELVQSERASLLLQNDQSDSFQAKAALGIHVNLMVEPDVGGRVSKLVLEDGKPVVVEDITRIGIRSAPADWRYKTPSFLSYPILIGERRIGVLNFTDKVNGDAFNERDLELLQAIAPQIAVAIDRTVLKDRAGELEHLSVTDAVTGLPNRRYLDKRLNEEIQRSKRHRFPMSLMMLDIDKFKSYNDTFGHQAGDAALRIVGQVLQDILRGADVAARYGGEEFAILLPQTTSSEAAAIAERLRHRIEHTEFPKRKVTVSIGIAACSSDIDSPEDIIGAADYALYEAKNHGRNNVQVYDGFGKAFNQKIN